MRDNGSFYSDYVWKGIVQIQVPQQFMHLVKISTCLTNTAHLKLVNSSDLSRFQRSSHEFWKFFCCSSCIHQIAPSLLLAKKSPWFHWHFTIGTWYCFQYSLMSWQNLPIPICLEKKYFGKWNLGSWVDFYRFFPLLRFDLPFLPFSNSRIVP